MYESSNPNALFYTKHNVLMGITPNINYKDSKLANNNTFTLVQRGINVGGYTVMKYILTKQQHAEATRVIVRLTLNKSTVHLKVQDNGRGFTLPESWSAFATEGRFGLFEAHERVLNIDGHFHVKSVQAPNAASGTLLTVTVPI